MFCWSSARLQRLCASTAGRWSLVLRPWFVETHLQRSTFNVQHPTSFVLGSWFFVLGLLTRDLRLASHFLLPTTHIQHPSSLSLVLCSLFFVLGLLTPTFNLQRSTFTVPPSTFNIQRSTSFVLSPRAPPRREGWDGHGRHAIVSAAGHRNRCGQGRVRIDQASPWLEVKWQ
jgi:hypothetical protein